jgi:hypothetical protein
VDVLTDLRRPAVDDSKVLSRGLTSVLLPDGVTGGSLIMRALVPQSPRSYVAVSRLG